jgi:hypothetical protein
MRFSIFCFIATWTTMVVEAGEKATITLAADVVAF